MVTRLQARHLLDESALFSTTVIHSINQKQTLLASAYFKTISINLNEESNSLFEGQTLLVRAVLSEQIELIQELIQAGANLDILVSNGNTALSLSAMSDREGVVAMLIRAGANINH